MNKELNIEFTRNPNIIRVRYDGELIWEHYYENGVDFMSALKQLMSHNDKEVYDMCIGACTFVEDGE